MFISVKRHEREKRQLLDANRGLTDCILGSSAIGLFVLGAKDRMQARVSASMPRLFQREVFEDVSIEKMLAPLVNAKVLSTVRAYITKLLAAEVAPPDSPLENLEVRLPKADGSFEAMHYHFDFTPMEAVEDEGRSWLVRVTDITARVQQQRELEDLRASLEAHAEILCAVLQAGGARFGGFLQKTDVSMKTIETVLKKPARETEVFRLKLEETITEVDRVRREAAALKLAGLEAAARDFEDALQDLRNRDTLSGNDFLPLAVKLDQLFVKFALIRTICQKSSAARGSEPSMNDTPMTANGTQIMEAPKFIAEMEQREQAARRAAQAGGLENTLQTLTDVVAQEFKKTVALECTGLDLVPGRYQATIKNVSIQLIRNAVMHGIETPDERQAADKPLHGTLQLEFRCLPDLSYELLFEDDGRGLDPDRVRATAIAKGLVTEEAAGRMRDRQIIKLIFKSGYTTLDSAPGETPHGAGMSLVRRYVHEAGGRIALASLIGHETRFKLALPALDADADAAAQVA